MFQPSTTITPNTSFLLTDRRMLLARLERAGIPPAGLTVHKRGIFASATWNREAMPDLDPAALESALRSIPGVGVQRVQVIQSPADVQNPTCIVTAWLQAVEVQTVRPTPQAAVNPFFKPANEGKPAPKPADYATYDQFYVQWSLWRNPQAGALVAGDRVTMRKGRQGKVVSVEQFAKRGQRMFRLAFVDLKTGEADSIELPEAATVTRITVTVYDPPIK